MNFKLKADDILISHCGIAQVNYRTNTMFRRRYRRVHLNIRNRTTTSVLYLPCPVSWSSHFRWNHSVPPLGWWFYPWGFWQRSASAKKWNEILSFWHNYLKAPSRINNIFFRSFVNASEKCPPFYLVSLREEEEQCGAAAKYWKGFMHPRYFQ